MPVLLASYDSMALAYAIVEGVRAQTAGSATSSVADPFVTKADCGQFAAAVVPIAPIYGEADGLLRPAVVSRCVNYRAKVVVGVDQPGHLRPLRLRNGGVGGASRAAGGESRRRPQRVVETHLPL